MVLGSMLQAQSPWKEAKSGYQYSFPRDHAAHPDFKIEWWYYTGNVKTSEGRRFGYQVTFFRVGIDHTPANPSKWAVRDLYMTHLAVSDPQGQRYRYAEKLTRGGPGLAGARSDTYYTWNDDWSAGLIAGSREPGAGSREPGAGSREPGAGSPEPGAGSREPRAGSREPGAGSREPGAGSREPGVGSRESRVGSRLQHQLHAIDPKAGIDLVLDEGKPPAINGINGINQKGAREGNASHYYSLTRMPTKGTISVDGERFEVTGETWMDHEFSTSFLEPEQRGWDWFSIQLSDNRELMLYRMRRADGSHDPRSSGTLVDAAGRTTHLSDRDFTLTPGRSTFRSKNGAVYPTEWSVAVPSQQIALTVTTPLNDQELSLVQSTGVAYWEGMISVAGSDAGKAVTGHGYLEMTGYYGSLGRIFQGP